MARQIYLIHYFTFFSISANGARMTTQLSSDKLLAYFQSLIGEGKHFANNKAMADYLGLPQTKATKLYNFLKGADTQYSAVLEWCGKLGIRMVKPDEKLTDYSLLPKVSAVAGAGESLETCSDIEGMYAFRTDFLNRVHINPDKSVMLLVRGDSMEPLIKDGDTVLVDQSKTLPEDGFIHLVTLDEALMIKRLQRIPNGWRLRSENPDRGYIDIEGDDQLNMFRVHGRVRWFGRVL